MRALKALGTWRRSSLYAAGRSSLYAVDRSEGVPRPHKDYFSEADRRRHPQPTRRALTPSPRALLSRRCDSGRGPPVPASGNSHPHAERTPSFRPHCSPRPPCQTSPMSTMLSPLRNLGWRENYNPLRGLTLAKVLALQEAGDPPPPALRRGMAGDLQGPPAWRALDPCLSRGDGGWLYRAIERSDEVIGTVITLVPGAPPRGGSSSPPRLIPLRALASSREILC